MKDLKAIRGRYYINECVERGENETQDFKFAVGDARKIARSISAFANNAGGQLLIGIKDNGVIAGVRNEEDIYVVEQAAEMYCHPAQHVEFTAFNIEPGIVVIRATVPRASQRPVMVDEGEGRLRAYYRVKDENIVAHTIMVEAWRRQNGNSSALISFDDNALSRNIMDILAEGKTDIHTLAIKTHSSMAAVTEMVTQLTVLGVITFVFDGTAFVPALAQ